MQEYITKVQPGVTADLFFEELTRINTAINKGELDFAFSLINILQRSGNEAPILIWLKIQILEARDNSEEVAKLYPLLLSRDAKPFYQFSYANFLYDKAKYRTSLEQYHLLLDATATPRLIRFYSLRSMGNIYVQAKDYAAGQESYDKANGIFANCDTLQVNYGILEIHKSNYEAAKGYFVRAIAMNQKNDMAWLGLSYCHQFNGEGALFKACVKKALDVNPNNKLAGKETHRISQSFSINGVENV